MMMGQQGTREIDDHRAQKASLPWHTRSIEECFAMLSVKRDSPKTGLTTAEAQRRLHQYGPNLLVAEKKKTTLLQRIWKRSSGKNKNMLNAQNFLPSDVLLVRDGRDVKVPAQQLVPGDIVKLNLGDRVPADLRLVEVSNLSALEAALTGEEVPVDKTVDTIESNNMTDPSLMPLPDRTNLCYAATLISQGSGIGVVVATGPDTEIVRFVRRRFQD